METIGVRDFQRNASAVLRRIERGEVLGITCRRRLVAVLRPPVMAEGTSSVVSSDGVRMRTVRDGWLPDPVAGQQPSGIVLDELRSDRR